MEPRELDSLVEALTGRLFVEIEASGRHVHVTAQQAKTLFGHSLTERRPLSQPGQFLANERVTVIGPKGELRDVLLKLEFTKLMDKLLPAAPAAEQGRSQR